MFTKSKAAAVSGVNRAVWSAIAWSSAIFANLNGGGAYQGTFYNCVFTNNSVIDGNPIATVAGAPIKVFCMTRVWSAIRRREAAAAMAKHAFQLFCHEQQEF
jgi:hypothetical protein